MPCMKRTSAAVNGGLPLSARTTSDGLGRGGFCAARTTGQPAAMMSSAAASGAAFMGSLLRFAPASVLTYDRSARKQSLVCPARLLFDHEVSAALLGGALARFHFVELA